jgi:hypothetical protein
MVRQRVDSQTLVGCAARNLQSGATHEARGGGAVGSAMVFQILGPVDARLDDEPVR